MEWLNEPNTDNVNPNSRSCGANVCWSRDENDDCFADYCVIRACITRFCFQDYS